jgi:hypothetical protein
MTSSTAVCPFYEPPRSHFVELTRQPRLTSWDAAGHPSQLALTDFLDHAEQDLKDQLRAAPPWALELDIGLRATTPLLYHHDLDNYLCPLAHRLGSGRVVSARARKRHADRSLVRIGTAQPAPAAVKWTAYRARTTASATTTAYKQQIYGQLAAAGAQPLPTGTPMTAVLGFRCGPRRNWLNLWKPTIDALGHLIGEGDRIWIPRDGAIVDLALHLEIDPALRWEVDVFAQVAPTRL